jgi:hypothetical protein
MGFKAAYGCRYDPWESNRYKERNIWFSWKLQYHRAGLATAPIAEAIGPKGIEGNMVQV